MLRRGLKRLQKVRAKTQKRVHSIDFRKSVYVFVQIFFVTFLVKLEKRLFGEANTRIRDCVFIDKNDFYPTVHGVLTIAPARPGESDSEEYALDIK
uniref:Uncharacterized protein n=1 Tax=Caenorhabditis japonica TaxID=281687 RepID=A0A8R1IVR0_CAEJA